MKSLLSLCELNIPVWELFIHLFIYLFIEKKKRFSQQSVRRFLVLKLCWTKAISFIWVACKLLMIYDFVNACMPLNKPNVKY